MRLYKLKSVLLWEEADLIRGMGAVWRKWKPFCGTFFMPERQLVELERSSHALRTTKIFETRIWFLFILFMDMWMKFEPPKSLKTGNGFSSNFSWTC